MNSPSACHPCLTLCCLHHAVSQAHKGHNRLRDPLSSSCQPKSRTLYCQQLPQRGRQHYTSKFIPNINWLATASQFGRQHIPTTVNWVRLVEGTATLSPTAFFPTGRATSYNLPTAMVDCVDTPQPSNLWNLSGWATVAFRWHIITSNEQKSKHSH